MGRPYYTLQTPDIEPDIYPEKFDTYEEAYDKMCDIYTNSKEMPFGMVVRYGIYRTCETEWNGVHNIMTQPVWR